MSYYPLDKIAIRKIAISYFVTCGIELLQRPSLVRAGTEINIRVCQE